jgi:hypothetical protein
MQSCINHAFCKPVKLPYFPAYKMHWGKSRTPNFQVNSQTKTLDKTHLRKGAVKHNTVSAYMRVHSTDTHHNCSMQSTGSKLLFNGQTKPNQGTYWYVVSCFNIFLLIKICVRYCFSWLRDSNCDRDMRYRHIYSVLTRTKIWFLHDALVYPWIWQHICILVHVIINW